MSLASWAALRQIEAVRVATATALQFGTIAKGERQVSDDEVRKWLAEQGMDYPKEFPPYVLTALTVKHGQHARAAEILRRGQAGEFEADIGRERSGAEFNDQTDFVLTSGFVRILGAHEQFERDVLKALLYYRPVGPTAPKEYVDETIGDDVIREQPVGKQYSKPAIWTWLSKETQKNEVRKTLFQAVYGISTLPDKASNEARDGYYKKRNAIAHAYKGVSMTLSEYQGAETHLINAVLHLIDECAKKYRLHV